MLPGRPKKSNDKPARQARARSNDTNALAVTDPDMKKATAAAKTKAGRPRRKSDPTKPRATRKRSLLACILSDKRLTVADKTKIREAHADGLTVSDLAALTVYELKMAQKFFEAGEMSAKDLVVAVNKVASHVAACAQLGAASASSGANITVTFDVGEAPTSTRPEAANHGTPDPVIGDLINTEE